MKKVRLKHHLSIALLCSALLSACSSTPTQPVVINKNKIDLHTNSIKHLTQFKIVGRMAVNYQSKGYSGNIAWFHENTNDTMDIFSPLGSKLVNIQKQGHSVTLTNQDKQIIQAETVEHLTEKVLGWRLPLEGMHDWMLGRPKPNGLIQNITWDIDGRLKSLNQDGWEIEYLDYQMLDEVALPKKLTIRNEKAFLKIIVNEWLNVQ